MSGAEDLDSDLPERRDPADAIVRVLEIVNKKGLHARASAKFCQTIERFDAAVRVTRGSETVGGTSIMGLMMLGAATGTTITVEATGSEATAAIDAIEKLVCGGFGRDLPHIKKSLYLHCTARWALL
jgi:phosphocarrier protein HPr